MTMSCGLTLQICLIIALSFRCRRWRFGVVNSQVSVHGALRSAHKSCTYGHVSLKRGGVKRELVADPRSFLLYKSSVSESSATFIGMPHVIEPQPQNGRHLRLFDLHLHRLVAHTLQVQCNHSVHSLGIDSKSKIFGFNWLL